MRKPRKGAAPKKTAQRLAASRAQLLAIREEVKEGYVKQDFSYRLYVPLSEVPKDVNIPVSRVTTIFDEKGNLVEAVEYTQATWPRTLSQLPEGLSKIEGWNRHEQEAGRKAWELIQKAFPETKELNISSQPTLWVHYPKPKKRLGNAAKTVEGEI